MPDPVIYQNPLTGTRWAATGDNVALLLSWGWEPVGDPGEAIETSLDDVLAAGISDAGSQTRAAIEALVAAPLDGFLPRISGRSVPGEAGIPTIMSVPPTITFVGAGSPSSTITSAVAIPSIVDGEPDTDRFSFRGGPWSQKGLTGVDPFFAAPTSLTGAEPAIYPYVEFLYYGTAFEFGYKGQGTLDTRVWVDGQPAEAPYTSDSTQDGAGHLRKITFGSVGWRRIRLDVTYFWQLNVGPTDVVIPAPSAGDKLLVIHDSYGEGTGANFFGGYPVTVAQMLGFNDMISLSQGGTGVLATNPGLGRPKYRDRADDWEQVGATAVLIGMSINDDGSTASAVATELALLLPIVRALPTVRDVWVMGPAPRGGHPSEVADKRARDAVYEPVVEAAGAIYVSLVSPTSIWTGTGHQGATTGDGSSDVLMWTDAAHPTQAGHDGIARTFVNRLLVALPS